MTPTKAELHRGNLEMLYHDTALRFSDGVEPVQAIIDDHERRRMVINDHFSAVTQDDIDQLREAVVALCGSVIP